MTQRKKWSELTTGQRMAGTLGAVLQLALLAADLAPRARLLRRALPMFSGNN